MKIKDKIDARNRDIKNKEEWESISDEEKLKRMEEMSKKYLRE